MHFYSLKHYFQRTQYFSHKISLIMPTPMPQKKYCFMHQFGAERIVLCSLHYNTNSYASEESSINFIWIQETHSIYGTMHIYIRQYEKVEAQISQVISSRKTTNFRLQDVSFNNQTFQITHNDGPSLPNPPISTF